MVLSPNKTPITKSTVDTKDENQEEIYCLAKRTLKNLVDGGTNKSSAEKVSSGTGAKRSAHKRLGEAVTQVSKWFENARWSLSHRPQMESNTPEKPHESEAPIITKSTLSNQVTPQTLDLGAGVENLVTHTNGENAGIGKSRKGKVEKGLATACACTIEQNARANAPSPQLDTSKRQTRNSNILLDSW